ncbi:hypothetical protein Sjap_004442 [Stephania japonica]|uniref:Uncharacterized protein n=1 Tax=Stephania japonica TaxID=461633 RepID=A0AAP0K399_9MAGN
MNLTEQELDQWIEQRDQEAEEEIKSILQKISAETMSAIPLLSVEVNEVTPIEDYWSEPEEIIEVSLYEPDISIAQNEADEVEKEIYVILERSEELQKESKEDQPLVLVEPPILPCLPVKFTKGVVIKERSQIFYTAETFVSADHDLIDSYVLEVPDELLHLKEGMYDELPKAIDAPFVVDISKGEGITLVFESARVHSLILILNLEDKVRDKFGDVLVDEAHSVEAHLVAVEAALIEADREAEGALRERRELLGPTCELAAPTPLLHHPVPSSPPSRPLFPAVVPTGGCSVVVVVTFSPPLITLCHCHFGPLRHHRLYPASSPLLRHHCLCSDRIFLRLCSSIVTSAPQHSAINGASTLARISQTVDQDLDQGMALHQVSGKAVVSRLRLVEGVSRTYAAPPSSRGSYSSNTPERGLALSRPPPPSVIRRPAIRPAPFGPPSRPASRPRLTEGTLDLRRDALSPPTEQLISTGLAELTSMTRPSQNSTPSSSAHHYTPSSYAGGMSAGATHDSPSSSTHPSTPSFAPRHLPNVKMPHDPTSPPELIGEMDSVKAPIYGVAPCYSLHPFDVCAWKMTNTFKKGECPIYVTEEAWRRYVEYWESDDFKARSKIASSNRRTEKGGPGTGMSKHTGGSIPFLVHEERLSKELGRDCTPLELYLHMHTKKHDGQTFIDARSERVNAEIQRMREEMSQSAEEAGDDPHVDETDLYYKVVGVDHKGRSMRGGHPGASSFHPPPPCLPSRPPLRPPHQETLTPPTVVPTLTLDANDIYHPRMYEPEDEEQTNLPLQQEWIDAF